MTLKSPLPTLARLGRHLPGRRQLLGAAVAAALVPMAPAMADDHGNYPDKPVKILVGFSAGGGVDSIARALAEQLAAEMDASFVVENRPGAAGTIAADVAAKANPDGYTLFFSETAFLIAQSIMPTMKLRVGQDFVPVASVAKLPLALTVHPSMPVETTTELIELLKENPDKYSYGSAGVGTPHHFIFEMFADKTGASATHVPYKGGTPMVPDILEGRIDIAMLSTSVAAPHVKEGTLKALGVTTANPVSNMPDVPPLADTVDGFDIASSFFVLAPAGTPEAIVSQLNEAISAAVQTPKFEQVLEMRGAMPAVSTVDELNDELTEESAAWDAIAKNVGIELN